MSGIGLPGYGPSLARIGGRASAHWQRQVARRTARLDALRRAMAWAEALLAPFPALGEGPLFGRSLGTFFQYETPRPPGRSPQAPAAPHARRAWWEQPSGQAGRDAREATASAGRPLSAAGHRAPSTTLDLSWLPARVDGARLKRLVGTTGEGERDAPSRRRSPGEQITPLAESAPLPPPAAGSCQDWLRSLTRRVEDRLFQYQPGGGPPPDGGRFPPAPHAELWMGPVAPGELLARAAAAAGEPGPPAGEGPPAVRPGSLPEHAPGAGAPKPSVPAATAGARRSAALDGGRAGERARAGPGPAAVQGPQPARPEPLPKRPPGAGTATPPAGPAGARRSAALDGGRAGERTRAGASRGAQRAEGGGGITSQRIGGLMAPLELLHALNRPPRGTLPEGRAGGGGGEGHPSGAQPETTLRQESPPSIAGRVGLGVAAEEMPLPLYPEALGRYEPDPTAGISPPTLAPSYPLLAPPRVASAPPAPIATAVVQRGAGMTEAAQEGSDLGELAARIKRILDEEARRHGIDV